MFKMQFFCGSYITNNLCGVEFLPFYDPHLCLYNRQSKVATFKGGLYVESVITEEQPSEQVR